jgi:predicted amidophosphoribosyltransferase
MKALKDDEVIPEVSMLMSDYVAELIKNNLQNMPFSSLFETNPTLIPTPKSSLMKRDTLWVPQRLASALVKRGLGRGVEECLVRVRAVRRSATSQPADRPKAFEHYDSMEVQKVFPEPTEMLMIDDIVTRGATLLGGANRLAEAFPNARIRVFAAMRTISPPDPFKSITDPCTGNIELRGIDTYRRP